MLNALKKTLGLDEEGKKRRASLKNLRAKLVARSCFNDEAGTHVTFTPAQATRLGLKSSKVLDRIFDVCQRLNGMTEEDIEELAEN